MAKESRVSRFIAPLEEEVAALVKNESNYRKKPAVSYLITGPVDLQLEVSLVPPATIPNKPSPSSNLVGIRAGEEREFSGIKFCWIPTGSFTMGSPENEKDREKDENQVQVQITRGFWMAKHEITVGQFRRFANATGHVTDAEKGTELQVGDKTYGRGAFGWNAAKSEGEFDEKYSWRNPGFAQDEQHPVTCVSYNDARAFCHWFQKEAGVSIRLPTEAQWEYACRAGTRPCLRSQEFI